MNLILASSNEHKRVELSQLLDQSLLQISLHTETLEVEETGDSFTENALLKAEAYFKRFNTPVLADDSGLIVIDLPNELGIHSARFGGDGLNDRDRYELLLKKLNEIPDSKREAYFICLLCFFLNPKEIFFFEGRLSGKIAYQASGSKGFGYDPVFLPHALNGQSLAENPEFKAQNSHRAVACRAAKDFFSRSNSLGY